MADKRAYDGSKPREHDPQAVEKYLLRKKQEAFEEINDLELSYNNEWGGTVKQRQIGKQIIKKTEEAAKLADRLGDYYIAESRPEAVDAMLDAAKEYIFAANYAEKIKDHREAARLNTRSAQQNEKAEKAGKYLGIKVQVSDWYGIPTSPQELREKARSFRKGLALKKLESRMDPREVDQLLEKRKNRKNLLGKIHLIGFIIIGVIGIFFLSPNLTGNVIGSLSANASNLAGAILFFIGVIGLFFTFKKK